MQVPSTRLTRRWNLPKTRHDPPPIHDVSDIISSEGVRDPFLFGRTQFRCTVQLKRDGRQLTWCTSDRREMETWLREYENYRECRDNEYVSAQYALPRYHATGDEGVNWCHATRNRVTLENEKREKDTRTLARRAAHGHSPLSKKASSAMIASALCGSPRFRRNVPKKMKGPPDTNPERETEIAALRRGLSNAISRIQDLEREVRLLKLRSP